MRLMFKSLKTTRFGQSFCICSYYVVVDTIFSENTLHILTIDTTFLPIENRVFFNTTFINAKYHK